MEGFRDLLGLEVYSLLLNSRAFGLLGSPELQSHKVWSEFPRNPYSPKP